MGRAAKTKRSQKRKQARRAAKKAKQTLYASLRGTSKKGKKVRVRTRAGISNFKHSHLIPHCGNVGCLKCYPEHAHKRANGKMATYKSK